MANLFTGNIELEGGYKVLATEADVTFTEGNTYRIQVGSPCYLREGTTGKGFLALPSDKIRFDQKTSDLYIGQYSDKAIVEVNIAE